MLIYESLSGVKCCQYNRIAYQFYLARTNPHLTLLLKTTLIVLLTSLYIFICKNRESALRFTTTSFVHIFVMWWVTNNVKLCLFKFNTTLEIDIDIFQLVTSDIRVWTITFDIFQLVTSDIWVWTITFDIYISFREPNDILSPTHREIEERARVSLQCPLTYGCLVDGGIEDSVEHNGRARRKSIETNLSALPRPTLLSASEERRVWLFSLCPLICGSQILINL
jgi:hypothetical protein